MLKSLISQNISKNEVCKRNFFLAEILQSSPNLHALFSFRCPKMKLNNLVILAFLTVQLALFVNGMGICFGGYPQCCAKGIIHKSRGQLRGRGHSMENIVAGVTFQFWAILYQ